DFDAGRDVDSRAWVAGGLGAGARAEREGSGGEAGLEKLAAIHRPMVQRHHDADAATARQAQPARNARPPIGVIAPRTVAPDRASAYRLPENRAMPATKDHPAAVVSQPLMRAMTSDVRTSASAWYI